MWALLTHNISGYSFLILELLFMLLLLLIITDILLVANAC